MDESVPTKKTLTTKCRENPFILSTIVAGVFAILLLVLLLFTSSGDVSESEAIGAFEKFADSQIEGLEILRAEKNSNLYKIDFISSQTEESSIFITADGKYLVTGLIPLSSNTGSLAPMLECAEPYGISSDTIVFYYSNSCGWCAKMKPGVEALEKEGYNFHWIEGSDEEASELIDNCIGDYMTSGGVPQFICPRTDEIYVGAFTDEDGNLNQSALKEWVDACISN